MAIREAEPERFERAALRWLTRYAVEKAGSVADVRAAADAFALMVQRPEDALAPAGTRVGVCDGHTFAAGSRRFAEWRRRARLR